MKKVIIGVVVLVACGGLFYWQHGQIRELKAENASLEALASEVDLLREEAEELKKRQVSPEEAERARQSQAELLRLRGEVSRLRDQLKKEQSANQAAAQQRAAVVPAPVTEEAPPPVETYTATLRATLAPQQTLVAGGWKMPNGNRVIVMVEPSLIGNAGEPAQGEAAQVSIQARFVELSPESMQKFGLDGVRAEGRESSYQGVLSNEQTQALMSQLQETQGVNVMTAPRISTQVGRQAQINATSRRTIDGADYDVGHSIDLVPRISPDGTTLDLSVTAKLRRETNPQN